MSNNIVYKPALPLSYSEYLISVFPEIFAEDESIKTITFQVTENCCLQCTYCYQKHNTDNEMTFEDIKPWLTDVLNDRIPYISTANTKGVIWDFIGGEPFLKIHLIREIADYIYNTMIELDHPWLLFTKMNISSNGLLYFTPEVQDYLTKYAHFVSLSISLDGNKELHDKCRLDLEGKGSYDRVIAAVRHFKEYTGNMPGIKMTFAPENLPYLSESYKYLISEGYTELWGNCVFEDVWSPQDATTLYYQLKQLADYIIDNDLYDKIFISFFEEDNFVPLPETDNDNWCGGVSNNMFALDSKGFIYHCIRFMDSSLQGEQKPISIGDLEHGIGVLPEHIENIQMCSKITRRSQSTDECFYCPIAQGCAWCSGYNYQKFGTPDKRATFICGQHKGRALANVYYWNKLFKKLNIDKTFTNYLPETESLKIIPQSELNLLNSLERK